MTRAVFLDRDGVLLEAIVRHGRPYAPRSLAQVRYRPGAAEALRELRQAGYAIIVVTNQPDVGKGVQRREAVEAIHAQLRRRLPVDDIKVCYHVDEDGCACRKPKPGLLLEAAREQGIDLDRSIMVGDRWRDIEAGKAAGCRTILLRNTYAERQPEAPDAIVESLRQASRVIRLKWSEAQPVEVGHASA